MAPAFELFLVLEPLRVCFQHFARALGPIDGLGPMLTAVELRYQPTTDVGLITLTLDRMRVGPAGFARIYEIAASAGVPVLDPRQLAPGDRQRFYRHYLTIYPLHERFANLTKALSRVLAAPSANPPRPVRMGRVVMTPDEGRPLPEPPPVLERRRLGSTPPGVPVVRAGRAPLGKLAPRHRSPSERERYTLVEQAAIARADASHRAPTVPLPVLETPSGPIDFEAGRPTEKNTDPPEFAAGRPTVKDTDPPLAALRAARAAKLPPIPPPPPRSLAPPAPEPCDRVSPRGKQKDRTPRHPTVPETPRARALPARSVASGTGPNPILTDDDLVTPAIEIRYLRGREWAPARLGSLSLKGAYVVTGAPPGPGDAVRIALRFAGEHATLSGVVHRITTAEEAGRTGASGFALRFPPVASAEREQLVSLLRHARAAGVTIKPPPPREAVRFPLNWPVRIGTSRQGFTAEARDVSLTGMFVATGKTLPTGEVVVRVPLDNREAAVCGRARIARHLDRDTAIRRGLHSGYGLAFLDLVCDDDRYAGFLSRVRLRTQKRVLIGAALDRLGTLCATLAGVGYTVSGGSDAETLVQLLHRHAPPDVAIIDASFASRGPHRNQLAQLFASREVPSIASAGEAAQQTRVVVDQLLGVTT